MLEQHLCLFSAAHRRLETLLDVGHEHPLLLQRVLRCQLEAPDGVDGTAYELALHYGDFKTAELLASSRSAARESASGCQQLLLAVMPSRWLF